jgi:hypothetical protein
MLDRSLISPFRQTATFYFKTLIEFKRHDMSLLPQLQIIQNINVRAAPADNKKTIRSLKMFRSLKYATIILAHNRPAFPPGLTPFVWVWNFAEDYISLRKLMCMQHPYALILEVEFWHLAEGSVRRTEIAD